MISQALMLSATGIGFVFMFLVLLVLVVRSMSTIALHLSPPQDVTLYSPDATELNNKHQAALVAASTHHYRLHSTRKTT